MKFIKVSNILLLYLLPNLKEQIDYEVNQSGFHFKLVFIKPLANLIDLNGVDGIFFLVYREVNVVTILLFLRPILFQFLMLQLLGF